MMRKSDYAGKMKLMCSRLFLNSFFAVCFGMLLISPAVARGAKTVLVEDGQAVAEIIIADDPYPIAAYAAQELVYHVELATGVALPIRGESEAGGDAEHRVYIGQSNAAREAGIHHDELASEQCVIRSVGADLFIVGNDGPGHPLSRSNTHSGTLWGVYELLEDVLDVRWLWPGELGIDITGTDDVAISSRDQSVQPAMVRRHIRTPIHWGGGDELDRFDYSLHGMLRTPQRLGTAYSSDEALDRYVWDEVIFLRRHRIGRSDDPRPYTGHSFRGWWEEYGEQHPEWFQKLPEGEEADRWRRRFGSVYGVGGVPEGGWEDHRGSVNPDRPRFTSMCVSNEEFQQEIVNRWVERREDDPDTIIRVGENDIRALCACEECLALDAPQPTDEEFGRIPGYARGQYEPFDAGRRYAKFWKGVHEKAMEVDPDAVVTAFVYLNYFVAPDDVDLHENIVLSFCPWGGWWFPRDPREQQWLREQWHNWEDTGATLYYRPNYLLNGGAMPHVYARQMIEELSYFYRHGSIGTDFDTLTGQWAVNGTTLYALSRFHNRPELSAEEMLDEYYAAFGGASLHVKAYFDFWEAHTTYNRAIKGFGGSTHLYHRRAPDLYKSEHFDHAQRILDSAAEAVADDNDDIYYRRVQYLQKGLTHARKSAALAKVFMDSDSDKDARMDALKDLVSFRREIEDLHVANLTYAGRWDPVPAVRGWDDEFEFDINDLELD